jgi:outer membrane protein TolC
VRARPTFLLLGMLAGGCASSGDSTPDVPPPLQTNRVPFPISSEIRPVGAIEPADPAINDLFTDRAELTEGELIAQVLARNPTVAQMAAAAQAAAARYPQVTSLEDPRFGGFIAPASIGSRDVDFGYRVEVSQAFPFPGKLAIRGAGARQEAEAAAADLDGARLALTEAARAAFADYFLAARSAEVIAEGLKLLGEFRENAAARYRAAQGEQQDVFQADVEIARQKERSLAVERRQRVTRARLNTLVHRPADAPLPPPPKTLGTADPLPPAAELRDLAARRRPDVAALRARIGVEEAAVASAVQEYNPDFEAMAAYDAWWQRPERDLRPMVGLRLNLPIRTGRRDAAVAEAQARLAQRRAELAKAVDQAGFEVQEAYEQVEEADRALKLYEESALPAARESVRLARSSYTTGKIPFLTLIEAQRNLVGLRDRQFELQAEARRRRAALDRATGQPTPAAPMPPTQVLPPVTLSLP